MNPLPRNDNSIWNTLKSICPAIGVPSSHPDETEQGQFQVPTPITRTSSCVSVITSFDFSGSEQPFTHDLHRIEQEQIDLLRENVSENNQLLMCQAPICDPLPELYTFHRLEKLIPLHLSPKGRTKLGGSIHRVLDAYETHATHLAQLGLQNHNTFYTLFTDARASDDVREAVQRLRLLQQRNQNFHVLPFGIGNDINYELLKQLRLDGTVYDVSKHDFSHVFRQFSKLLIRASKRLLRRNDLLPELKLFVPPLEDE